MSLVAEIARSWRNPRAVMRRQLERGVREDRALAYLILACFIIFVAQWPRLSREAHLDPSVPLDARLGGALFGLMFILPLLAYGLAALSHLVARIIGGRGGHFGARLALFWALLASWPLWLFDGLVTGFIGPGPASTASGSLLAVAFLGMWLLSLAEAEGIGGR